MTRDQIIATQKRIGTTPDGFWGPKSIAACKAHLRKLMPANNPWPKSDQKSLQAFYGSPGDESQLVSFTFPFPTFYEGTPVKTSRCHKKVKDSLLRVLSQILALYGKDGRIMAAIKDYGGIFNFRSMRGSGAISVHSWGAAGDWSPSKNAYKATWPVAASMPIEIMEEFAKEGWLPAGAFWGYDAMHFQATR